jgi:NAD(P)-dependent dehydrogenase (short-subunit alcohol dehydrogenase family)
VSDPTTEPVVLIPGATGVLGRAATRRFARDGALLVLVGRDLGRLQALAADTRLDPARRVLVPADLRDRDAARSMADQAIARFGRVDVLLQAIGGWAGGTAVVDLDPDQVRQMLDQHLWTTLYAIQAVVPGMLQHGFGRLLAVSTPVAANPGATGAAYAIAKSAEELLLRSIAKQSAGTGLTANLLVVKSIAAPGQGSGTSVDDLVDMIAYLASPAAGSITGQRITVGG